MDEVIERLRKLDGLAVANVNEPSPGDLSRVLSENSRLIGELQQVKDSHARQVQLNDQIHAKNRKLVECLKQICKVKYGLQGFVEEDDLHGERDYLAKLAFGYEDLARQTLKDIGETNG